MYKECSKCGIYKPSFEFYKEKRYGDGLASECKKCRGKTLRQYKRTEKGKRVNNKSHQRYYKTESGKKLLKT